MRYYKQVGYLSCALLIISSFLPWAYYPDLHKTFNGFFSENNNYGKPGIFFTFFALVGMLLIYIDKIWAKRTMIFVSALTLGYMIKTFILFTSCYNTICPDKRIGIYLLVVSCIVMMVVALFPDMKVQTKNAVERPS